MPVAAIEAERIVVEQPVGSTTACCPCADATPTVHLAAVDAPGGDRASRDSK